jgi:hydrogenase nickel incorporation protein HypA/HybF
MHELALMDGLIDAVVAHTGDRPIARVVLAIGELAGVVPDALHFCFGVCSHATPLEHASLDIETVAGSAQCNACGLEAAMPALGTPCPCGSFDRAITRGQELQIAYVEVL